MRPLAASGDARRRSRLASPPMRMKALSPPPMRRASPPASTRPRVGGISCPLLMHGRFSPLLCALLLDIGEVLVEHDPVLAGKRHEPLATRPSAKRQVGLAGKLHAPGGKTRARHQDGDAHAH